MLLIFILFTSTCVFCDGFRNVPFGTWCDLQHEDSATGKRMCLSLIRRKMKINEAKDFCMTVSENPTSRLLKIEDEAKQDWILENIPKNYPNPVFRRVVIDSPIGDFANCVSCDDRDACYTFSLKTGLYYGEPDRICRNVKYNFICEEEIDDEVEYQHGGEGDDYSGINADLQITSSPNILTISFDVHGTGIENADVSVLDMGGCLSFSRFNDGGQSNNNMKTFESLVTIHTLLDCSLLTNGDDESSKVYETFVSVFATSSVDDEEVLYEDTWKIRIVVNEEVFVSVSDVLIYEDFNDDGEGTLEIIPDIVIRRYADETFTSELSNFVLEKSRQVYLIISSPIPITNPSLFLTENGPPFDSIGTGNIWEAAGVNFEVSNDEDDDDDYEIRLDFTVPDLSNAGIFNYLLIRFDVEYFSSMRREKIVSSRKYAVKKISITDSKTQNGDGNDGNPSTTTTIMNSMIVAVAVPLALSTLCVCIIGITILGCCLLLVLLNANTSCCCCFCVSSLILRRRRRRRKVVVKMEPTNNKDLLQSSQSSPSRDVVVMVDEVNPVEDEPNEDSIIENVVSTSVVRIEDVV